MNIQEKHGLSMLLITHDIALARKVSDRIAVLLDGQLVEEGRTCDLVSNPKHEHTKRLLESSAFIQESSSHVDNFNASETEVAVSRL